MIVVVWPSNKWKTTRSYNGNRSVNYIDKLQFQETYYANLVLFIKKNSTVKKYLWDSAVNL